MDRPISVPFVIIEFGQLEETVGEQLEEKMVIEKYLLPRTGESSKYFSRN